MDTANQFLYFSLCIGIGFCGGIIYEFFAVFRALLKCEKRNKIFGILLDIIFLAFFAGVCVYLAFVFDFPAIRIYMWIGYAIGGILYAKTLRRMVAFLEKVCYNMLSKVLKRQKRRKKFLNTGDKIL